MRGLVKVQKSPMSSRVQDGASRKATNVKPNARRPIIPAFTVAVDGRDDGNESECSIVTTTRSDILSSSLTTNTRDRNRYINIASRSCSMIGRGTFSRVYRALDSKKTILCAIKEIDVSNEVARKHAAVELDFFTKCAKTPHRNIIHCIRTFPSGTVARAKISIVMEYASLGSLQDIIDSTATLDIEFDHGNQDSVLPMRWVESVGKSIFLALDFLHSKLAVAHGDIKPGNCLLFRNGNIKLSDFGCCSSDVGLDGSNNEAPSRMETVTGGSLAFMSPEILLGISHTASRKGDVFSAGMTLLECVECSDQERGMDSFWDVLETQETRAKCVEGRKDLPISLKSFLQQCFRPEEKRPSAQDLLKSSFVRNADEDISVDTDAHFRRFVQGVEEDINVAFRTADKSM